MVGIVRTKMYLCHSEILMPKDTKSLGNNKAPACESRGFVRKKQKVCILTHLHHLLSKLQMIGVVDESLDRILAGCSNGSSIINDG